MTGELIPYFKPSRQFRRQFAGQPCPGCGNRVDARDLVAFVPGTGRTYYLHESCMHVMVEAADGAAADSTPEEEMAESAAATPTVPSTGDTMSLEPEEAQ